MDVEFILGIIVAAVPGWWFGTAFVPVFATSTDPLVPLPFGRLRSLPWSMYVVLALIAFAFIEFVPRHYQPYSLSAFLMGLLHQIRKVDAMERVLREMRSMESKETLSP